MHYYKRHIGDYSKKAGRLSILQHGVYNLLIDTCYDREEFPTTEEAIDWVWASTQEEIEAVKFVLRKFFKEENGRWVQKRIAEEIAEYHEFCEEQRRKGGLGGRPKKKPNGLDEKPNGFSEKPEANPEESKRGSKKSLTTNHKPLTTNQKREGRMKRPTLEELEAEFTERVHDPTRQAHKFFNHYESNGWKVGKNPMKSWQHAVTNWITRSNENGTHSGNYQSKSDQADESIRDLLQTQH